MPYLLIRRNCMIKITLKAARVNAGLTQDDVAAKMHHTKQTIVNWENGKTDIKYSELISLSELYGMPISYLQLPERKKPPKKEKAV